MYTHIFMTASEEKDLEAIRKRHSASRPEKAIKKIEADFIKNELRLAGIRATAADIRRAAAHPTLSKKDMVIRNMKRCFDIAFGKHSFDTDMILRLHAAMFKDIDGKAGMYRDHNREIYGSRFLPTDTMLIEEEVEKLVEYYSDLRKKTHPLELAAVIHLQFISIYPFEDGNGRIARLLMNHILWCSGFPPFMVSNKRRYLNSLEDCHINRVEEPFFDFVYEEYVKQNK